MPTVAFDVIGTLFSLQRLRASLDDLGAPANALELWFSQSLRDYFAFSHAGGYAPLAEVLDASLRRLLENRQLPSDDASRARVMETFTRLELSEGAQTACQRFREAGWRIIAVTNGGEKSTRSLLAAAKLETLFSTVLSCDALRVSKPHPRVYEKAKEHADGTLWMLASHAWDIAGAMRAGLRGAWVSFGEGRYLDVYPSPDVTASGLAQAAEKMIARNESSGAAG